MEENLSVTENGKKSAAKRNGVICLLLAAVALIVKLIFGRVSIMGEFSYEAFERAHTISLICYMIMALLVIISIIFFSRDPGIMKRRQEGEVFAKSKEELLITGIVVVIGFAVAALLVLVLKVSVFDDAYGDIMFFGIPISGLAYFIKAGLITSIPGFVRNGAVHVHNFVLFFFSIPYIGIPLGALAWGFFMLLYVGVCLGALLGALYSFVFIVLLKILTFVLCLLGFQVSSEIMDRIGIIVCLIAAVALGGTMFFTLAGALM